MFQTLSRKENRSSTGLLEWFCHLLNLEWILAESKRGLQSPPPTRLSCVPTPLQAHRLRQKMLRQEMSPLKVPLLMQRRRKLLEQPLLMPLSQRLNRQYLSSRLHLLSWCLSERNAQKRRVLKKQAPRWLTP
jgi:hypothetical protein